MSLIAKIDAFLSGECCMPTNPLTDYHRALKARNTNLSRDPIKRLIGIRAATQNYRITAFLQPDGTTIRLRRTDGQELLLKGRAS
jgi:hypothetical protein